jgi:hypothetical protein
MLAWRVQKKMLSEGAKNYCPINGSKNLEGNK